MKIIVCVLLLLSFLCVSVMAQEDGLAIMQISNEQKILFAEENKGLPTTEQVLTYPEPSEVNLLSYVPYIPSERDQGACGNCWAWAGTGVVEVAHTVQTGVYDRLSVQYLNSNMNGGGILPPTYSSSSYACDGGWASDFTAFYQGNESSSKFIPWSNTNASYFDGNGGQTGGYNGGNKTNMPAGFIENNPGYQVTNITTSRIPTWNIPDASAIANIKNELYNNRAVFFVFYLPNSSAWSNFRSFWRNESEDVTFDFDPYNGIPYTNGGGHVVLLVGYNDTDPNPALHYWEILNSWGVNSLRPNGTFRVPMEMNYSNIDGEGYANLYWDRIHTEFTSPLPAPVVTGIDPTFGIENSTITQINITGSNFGTGDRIDFLSMNTTYKMNFGVKSGNNLSIQQMNLSGMPLGVYDIRVTNLTTFWDGEKQGAFSVLPVGPTPTPTPTVTPTPVSGFMINASSDNLGYITPSGNVSVAAGGEQRFNLRSKPGAIINSVLVNGSPVSVPSGSTTFAYTFTNITSDGSIILTNEVLEDVVIASFDQNTTEGSSPLTVQFTDTSAGYPNQWYWKFGDGNVSLSQNPEYTYLNPGTYSVNLWVRNPSGSGSITKNNLISVY